MTQNNAPSEVWKDIQGYIGAYQASSLGRVRAVGRVIDRFHNGPFLKKEKVLAIRRGRDGYQSHRLSLNAIKREIKTHRLIAMAFLGESDLHVNHINGDKSDNRIENLEYITSRMNSIHALSRLGKYTGVYKTPKGWCSRITVNGKSEHIGNFNSPEEASRAYRERLSKIDEVKYGNYA